MKDTDLFLKNPAKKRKKNELWSKAVQQLSLKFTDNELTNKISELKLSEAWEQLTATTATNYLHLFIVLLVVFGSSS